MICSPVLPTPGVPIIRIRHRSFSRLAVLLAAGRVSVELVIDAPIARLGIAGLRLSSRLAKADMF